jgi:hypothetical protein
MLIMPMNSARQLRRLITPRCERGTWPRVRPAPRGVDAVIWRLRVAARSRLLFLCSRCQLCGGARSLLFLNLRERQAGADCDYIEDGMQWITRQAQPVHFFPGSNANVRWIQVRTALLQLEATLLRALVLFARKALGVGGDELTRGAMRGRVNSEAFRC